MIICVCRRVSDKQIHQAVAEGAHSLDCLGFELGVATQCGRCGDCAQRVLSEALGSGCAMRSAGPGSAAAGQPA